MGKIIITGPGRAGTSFLMQLLTRLDINTGFEPYNEPFNTDWRAGCEWVINYDLNEQTSDELHQRFEDAPKVLKACEWTLFLKGLLKLGVIEVDHIIMPVRDLYKAAQSRLDAGLDWMVQSDLEDEDRTIDQMYINAMALGLGVEVCMLYEIPCTMMLFPRLVECEEYCYYKLSRVFELDEQKFSRVFRELSKYST